MTFPATRRFQTPPPEPDSEPLSLYLNHDAALDRLVAIAYGAVEEGQPPGHWIDVTRSLSWLAPGDFTLGFRVERFSTFNPEAGVVRQIWLRPHFSVPTLGLTDVPAGEVIIGARHYFSSRSSVNHHYRAEASARSGEDSLPYWRACLESGDSTAHHSLGVTLFELGRHQEAYRHLRHYAEIAPHGAWNWCWYGRAAQALGHWNEARYCYEIAVELEDEGGDVTGARGWLDEL